MNEAEVVETYYPELGRNFEGRTTDQVEAELLAALYGSRGIVSHGWTEPNSAGLLIERGHYFNVINLAGHIIYLDAQTAQMYSPAYVREMYPVQYFLRTF